MIRNQFLLCLFGVMTCFVSGIVARAMVGGLLVANSQELPYTISVEVHGHGNICSGSIIRDKYIITAAHCIIDDNNKVMGTPVTIHAGTIDLRQKGVTAQVEKAFIPNEYKPPATTSIGDIAVLKLKEPLPRHDISHQIKIKKKDGVKDNDEVKISGFGWNQVNKGASNKETGGSDGHMRYRAANVVPNAKCKVDYGKDAHIVTDKHICARVEQRPKEQRGVCSGDSGGPLIYGGKTLVGVLSKSPLGCSEDKKPGIYTRVSEYADFVSKVLGDKGVEYRGGIREIPL